MIDFTTLESARLRLRHFRDSDLKEFMGYRIDPIVAKYQSWGGISERELRTFLQEQKEIQLRTSGLKGSGEMRIYMPSLKRNGYTKVITGTLKKRE